VAQPLTYATTADLGARLRKEAIATAKADARRFARLKRAAETV
jgi:hypothetical protein